MNGKKDIDPQSELDEREDEPTLPEIEEEPVDRFYGMREFTLRTPDGHVIAFGQDTTAG